MKKWIVILVLCIQCLLYSSCAHTETLGVSSVNSSSTSSYFNRRSSSVKNADDSICYTNEIVEDEYTGTYKSEKWILREENPEETSEIWSGPVTLRKVDEAVVISSIAVSGEYSLPLVTNDGAIQDLMSTVNEATVMAVLYNAAHFAYGSMDSHPAEIQNYSVPIPVSFLRNTAPGCYYTVNKLVSGGYMYLFLRDRMTNIALLRNRFMNISQRI